MQGRLAAGGNVTLAGYGLMSDTSATPETLVLIAGGDIQFDNGQIYSGSVLAGGSAAGITQSVRNGMAPGATIAEFAALPFNIADEFTQLRGTSVALSQAQTTGTVTYQYGGIYLEGDCTSTEQIFLIDGAQLINSHTFSIACMPADATLIFNVSGANPGMQNIGLGHLQDRSDKIIWNFFEAQTLTFGSISIQGTLLAPNAVVDSPWGSVNGTVIVKNWTGHMALQDSPFAGVIDDLINTNTPPSANNNAYTVDEDATVNIVLTGQDTDEDPLTFEVLDQTSNGTLSGDAPNLIYQPDADFHGTDIFTFKANDGEADSVLATITITINPVNDAPSAGALNLETLEDNNLLVALIGDDIDGDDLSYTIISPPSNGSIEGQGENITYMPTPNFNGTDEFTYTVSDGTAQSDPASVSITVLPVNDPPLPSPVTEFSIVAGEANVINVTAQDVDGDALTYILVDAPSNGILVGELPVVTYQPNSGFEGTDFLRFKISDGTLESDIVEIELFVSGDPDGPFYDPPNFSKPAINPDDDSDISPSSPEYFGALRGQHSVGPDGSFSYSIPIEVPPGINGVQPNLALQYNSNARNGYMGWGWNVAGIKSVISRCKANVVRDGYSSGINKDDNYKFCLNGQRLVEISSGEYRTESDSFRRIRRHGGSERVPTYWTVENRNGTTTYYGQEFNSTLKDDSSNGGAVYRWYISKQQDTAGNYLTHHYEISTGGMHRLARIEYTKNISVQGTYQKVEFHYENRPDIRSRYAAGTQLIDDQRLSSIKVSTNSQLVREYNLAYQVFGTQYDGASFDDLSETSRLYSVSLCYPSNSCTRPVEFSWTTARTEDFSLDFSTDEISYYENDAAEVDFDNTNLTHEQINFGKTGYPIHHTNGYWADFDGDNRKEFLRVDKCSLDSDSDCLFSRERKIYDDGGETSEFVDGYLSFDAGVISTQDMNGDGRADIIGTYSEGDVFVLISKFIDGKYELTREPGFDVPASQLTVAPDFLLRKQLIDFNGDGLPDLVRYPDIRMATTEQPLRFQSLRDEFHETMETTGEIAVALNTGSGFEDFSVWVDLANFPDIESIYQHTNNAAINHALKNLADVNGDTLPDIVLGKGLNVGINTGSGFTIDNVSWRGAYDSETALLPATAPKCAAENYFFNNVQLNPNGHYRFSLDDLNGDGLADIVYYDTRLVVSLSTGSSFTPFQIWADDIGICEIIPSDAGASEYWVHAAYSLFDVNRDGLKDLVALSHWHSGGLVAPLVGKGFLTTYDRADTSDHTYYIGKLSTGEKETRFSEPFLIHNSSNSGASGGTDAEVGDETAFYGFEVGENRELFYKNGAYLLYGREDNCFPGFDCFFPGEMLSYNYYNISPEINRIVKVVEQGESETKKIEIGYEETLHDATVYTQQISQGENKLGSQLIPNAFDDTDNGFEAVSFLNFPSKNVVGSIQVNVLGKLASQSHYQYKNLRTHISGFGELGFEQVQVTETIPTFLEKVRTVNHYHQEVGNNISYVLNGLKKSERCVVTDSTFGCQNASDKPISTTRKNWKIAAYGGYPSAYYFPFTLEEEMQNFDIATGTNTGTVLKSLSSTNALSSTQKQGCPVWADIEKGQRLLNGLTYHFHDLTPGTFSNTPKNSIEKRCDTFGVTGTHIENTNIQNQTTPWCIGLIQDPKIHAWIYDNESNDLSEITRHTKFSFDPTLCLVDIETREPNGADDIWLETHYDYNAYGSVSAITETVKDFTADGIAFISRTTDIDESFDSFSKRKIVTTNALGHETTEIFNAEFGLSEKFIDANGIESDSTYDLFGRIKSQTSLGVTTEYQYLQCTNCFAYSSDANWFAYQKTEGSRATRTYFDALNREVGTRWSGLTGTTYFTGMRFDDRGLLAASTQQFANVANAADLETQFQYDVLGRVIETQFPEEAHFPSAPIQLTDYAAIDGAAAVTTTDSLGRTRTQLFDALEREKQIIDALEGLVTYWHDAQGNTASIRVSNKDGTDAIYHTISFDILGRKTQLDDPDVGIIDYRYNAFGHLIEQINAEDERICYHYDELDRTVQRADGAALNCTGGVLQTWAYDRPTELGLLASVSGTDTKNRFHREEYQYTPDKKLPLSVTHTIDGNDYTTTNHYDAFNRTEGLTYPTGFTLEHFYNDQGHLNQIQNHHSGLELWAALEDDSYGNLTEMRLGNGATVSSQFSDKTGFLNTRIASLNGTLLQDHAYQFDSEGNLTWREDKRDASNSTRQNFCYDPLDRLADQKINTPCVDYNNGYTGTAYAYNIHGNILRKDDITDYQYGVDAGPHAVTQANGQDYLYDNAGRLILSPGQRTIDYSIFGKPTYMGFANGYQTEIIYGALQKRIQRNDIEGGVPTHTVYIDKLYERINGPEGIEHRYYMADWGVHVIKPSENQEYNVYLTRDHIGSLASKSDDQDANSPIIKFHANEPWGRRQEQSWAGVTYDTLSGDALKDITFATTRGFTDHEHLDGVGLIHMNGRVYDPVIGRFVSPDPMIQDPEFSQSFNRYSYVVNNPLKYTDPTGECGTKIDAIDDACDVLQEAVIPTTAEFEERGESGSLGSNIVGGVKQAGVAIAELGETTIAGRVTNFALEAVGSDVKTTSESIRSSIKNDELGGAAVVELGTSLLGTVKEGGKLFGKALQKGVEKVASKFKNTKDLNAGAGNVGEVVEALVDPNTIKFTQDSVKRTFGKGEDGPSLKGLIDDLKSGKVTADDIPAIRTFSKDGQTFSLDNRRLKAFQEAGVPIRTRPATTQEIANDAFKFTSKNDGESVKVRGGGL